MEEMRVARLGAWREAGDQNGRLLKATTFICLAALYLLASIGPVRRFVPSGRYS
jgi:hypothetical protein